MPLSLAPENQNNTIKKIYGKDDTIRFLKNLGFIVGQNVSVVSKNNGNIIVNVKDTRIAISASIANKIIV